MRTVIVLLIRLPGLDRKVTALVGCRGIIQNRRAPLQTENELGG